LDRQSGRVVAQLERRHQSLIRQDMGDNRAAFDTLC
jgi:hypothetical protein